ncbi:MAG: AEC family transporter [Opitutales bacterium]
MDAARAMAEDCRVVILDTIVPVFLIVALGAWWQRRSFVSPGFLKEANRLTYWVGLPALLFGQLAPALPSAAGVRPVLEVMLVATLLMVGAGYVLAGLGRLPGPVVGTFVQGAFRGNLAFVGLPVVFGLPDTELGHGLTLHQAAVVVVAPVMLLYNLAGVLVLLASQHRLGLGMIGPLARQLAVTPPFLAIMAGMLVALCHWHLPVALARALDALGEMTLPLGLLCVGGALVTSDLAAGWRRTGGAALAKTVLAPAIGWLCGRWWWLDPLALKLVLLFMATPTANVSYTLALELKGDAQLASGSIAVSVLTSVVTLAVIVGWF